MFLLLGSLLATQALHHFDGLFARSYGVTFASLYALALLLYYGVWRLVLWPRVFTPNRRIPGPDGHWFYGNFREIFRDPIGVPHMRWLKQYPNQAFIRYHGLFYAERLLVVSQAAHQYILTNCYAYPKPFDVGFALKTILGADGILFAEGDVHRRQRKQMNPSFSYGNLKNMMPIFWDKSQRLADAWAQLSENKTEIEVLEGLSATTLDIIGSAGFGYEFNAIDALTNSAKESPLAVAYADMFDTKKVSRVLAIFTYYLPFLRSLPFRRHTELNADIAMVKKMSDQIVSEKVRRLDSGAEIGSDIFALLLKDNRSKELERDPSNPPMTHQEVGSQTMTLLAAGHETTSAGTAWALHALSLDQAVQDRLRTEITSNISPNEEPTFEEIESLHYLNNVVKEVLRFYPPVPMTRRVALVSATIDGVLVPEGTEIFIAPIVTNKNPQIWGPDGEVFNPDRWDNLPSTHNNYGMETFLHGARGCIGQKFAIVEMKCLLASIVMNFKIQPKPGHVVETQASITMRPKGGLPLILTPA